MFTVMWKVEWHTHDRIMTVQVKYILSISVSCRTGVFMCLHSQRSNWTQKWTAVRSSPPQWGGRWSPAGVPPASPGRSERFRAPTFPWTSGRLQPASVYSDPGSSSVGNSSSFIIIRTTDKHWHDHWVNEETQWKGIQCINVTILTNMIPVNDFQCYTCCLHSDYF